MQKGKEKDCFRSPDLNAMNQQEYLFCEVFCPVCPAEVLILMEINGWRKNTTFKDIFSMADIH